MMKTNDTNITSIAFANFEKWAEGKDFNEILGCAKNNIDGLSIRLDVDDYGSNRIACRTMYVDNEGNFALVEVELDYSVDKPSLIFRNHTSENLNDKVAKVLDDYAKSNYESLSDYLANTEVNGNYTFEEIFDIYIGCQKAMWGDKYILRINGSGEEIEL